MNLRYMLDTDICIYISKRKPPEVKARFDCLKPGQVVMSVITYGELYYGASKSNQRTKAFAELERTVRGIPIENLTSAVSEAYGTIRAALEKQGRVIGNNDLWIAAHAMALDVTLATNNEREFLRVVGLSVENWTK
ncbi:MAG TPA: type II toxin-antitoxin system VapC family toxin [Candidatus Acidoferrales bacterium]|jgi:tRNA(fMet)-specific endonuclease VapC|nr:type II toxin-antitoxin system VapC family toxin [Candidatus Acidoferrales bacterium]